MENHYGGQQLDIDSDINTGNNWVPQRLHGTVSYTIILAGPVTLVPPLGKFVTGVNLRRLITQEGHMRFSRIVNECFWKKKFDSGDT